MWNFPFRSSYSTWLGINLDFHPRSFEAYMLISYSSQVNEGKAWGNEATQKSCDLAFKKESAHTSAHTHALVWILSANKKSHQAVKRTEAAVENIS